jgi:hypothetical protein
MTASPADGRHAAGEITAIGFRDGDHGYVHCQAGEGETTA